jgi:transmembrane sensor
MRKRPYPSKALSNEALAFVVRLHSGEASKRDWAAFRQWRSLSADHEAAAREAEALWSDAANLHQDPRTGLVRPGKKKKKRVSRRIMLGGIIGIGGAAAGGLWLSGAHRGFASDYVTGIGATRVIDLPDGSRATLNAMSAINVDFSGLLRRIELVEGQAFFEVAADAKRPFEVRAGLATATALGTAFDANRNLPDGEVAITVTEHAVEVGAAAAHSVVVKEGEKIVISGDGKLGAVVPEEKAVAAAWRSGQYIAEAEPLEAVVAALSAYHTGWIVIEDEKLKTFKVNAVLDLRSPEASLAALAAGLPIRVRHISRFFIVISAA